MNALSIFSKMIRDPEIYKFLIVGIGGALSTLSMTVIFTSLAGIFYPISVAISLESTLIWSFFAHEKWTFVNVPKILDMRIRFMKYNLLALIGIGVNEFVLILLTNQVKLHYTLSEIIAIIIAFFFNYLVHKKISWKN